MTIQEYIKNDSYFDSYEFKIIFEDSEVFEIWSKNDEGACVGYPTYVLNKNGKFEIADLDKTRKILHEICKNIDE